MDAKFAAARILIIDDDELMVSTLELMTRRLGHTAASSGSLREGTGMALAGDFDAIVAPYHDVGMAAFKTVSFGSGVNVTLGLPFVRTSPDHGTAFDLAGTGRADPASMSEALRLAVHLARARFDTDSARV